MALSIPKSRSAIRGLSIPLLARPPLLSPGRRPSGIPAGSLAAGGPVSFSRSVVVGGCLFFASLSAGCRFSRRFAPAAWVRFARLRFGGRFAPA